MGWTSVVPDETPGLIVAAPASGGGKTLLTLALLAYLRREGRAVRAFKTGPDYIDPGFHARASGAPCPNLDPWAMRPQSLGAIWRALAGAAEIVLGEGVMGLFDGARDGTGSTADLAAELGLPVVLVLDVRGQAASAAAVAHGFAGYRSNVTVAGVICNRVGGPGHAAMLRRALDEAGIACFGCLPRAPALALPSRHLGLVQASELDDFDALLARAADWVGDHLDIDALLAAAARPRPPGADGRAPLSPSASASPSPGTPPSLSPTSPSSTAGAGKAPSSCRSPRSPTRRRRPGPTRSICPADIPNCMAPPSPRPAIFAMDSKARRHAARWSMASAAASWRWAGVWWMPRGSATPWPACYRSKPASKHPACISATGA